MNTIKKLIKRWKEKRDVDLSEQDFSVNLHPILGIEPKIYLRVLFSLCIILLFFLLFILPGIKKNGSYLVVESTPNQSGVLINNQFKGTTPCTFYMPKGDYKISLSYPGVGKNSQPIIIKGRLFFSKFFPRKQNIILTAETEFPKLLMDSILEKMKVLSCYESFRKGTNPPPITTYAVEKLLENTNFNSAEKAFISFYNNALSLATNRILKVDLLKGLELWYQSQPNQYSNASIAIGKQLLSSSKNDPGLFFNYYYSLSSKEQKEIKKSIYYQSYINSLISYYSITPSKNFGTATGKTLKAYGMVFNQYNGGTGYIGGNPASLILKNLKLGRIPDNFPRVYEGGNFYLSANPVNFLDINIFVKKQQSTFSDYNEWEQNWLSNNIINRYFSNFPQSNLLDNERSVRFCSYNLAVKYIQQLKPVGNLKPSLPSLIELKKVIANKPNFIKRSVKTIEIDDKNTTNKDEGKYEYYFLQEWVQENRGLTGAINNNTLPQAYALFYSQNKIDKTIVANANAFPTNFCMERTTFRIALNDSLSQIKLRDFQLMD